MGLLRKRTNMDAKSKRNVSAFQVSSPEEQPQLQQEIVSPSPGQVWRSPASDCEQKEATPTQNIAWKGNMNGKLYGKEATPNWEHWKGSPSYSEREHVWKILCTSLRGLRLPKGAHGHTLYASQLKGKLWFGISEKKRRQQPSSSCGCTHL